MQDINLYHLLKFYAKKWVYIAAFTVIGAAIGLVYNDFIQTPLYKSDATLLLVGSNSASDQRTTLINNYIELIKSRRVLDPVLQDYSNKITYDNLVEAVSATNDKNTEVIKVSIASKDAETSKTLTDGVIKSFKNEIKKMYNLDNIIVVDNANKATEPYNVHKPLTIGLTAIAGFCISAIAIFFAYDINLTKGSEKTKATTNNKNKSANRRAFVKKATEILVGPNPATQKPATKKAKTKASK